MSENESPAWNGYFGMDRSNAKLEECFPDDFQDVINAKLRSADWALEAIK